MDNFLAQLMRGGTPQRPTAYPRPDNLEDNFALMADAGWFNAPQEGQQVTQFDPMATDSRLGNAPTVANEKNALNALFQGAIFGGDLDKAARLAVTPEQQAMLSVAYGQRMDRQGGGRGNQMNDYQRAQETSLARARMEEDRQVKMDEIKARTGKIQAETALRAKQTTLAGQPRPGQMIKTPESEAQKAFNVELAKLDAKELDDLRGFSLKAQSGLQRVQQMRELADSNAGIYSGSFAEGRVGVANFFDSIGLPFDQKKLANSQEYLKHAKELTLSVLKEGVGASQISNADLKFVNESVPQLETNPEARKNLLNFIEKKLQTSVDRFGKADEYARANGGLRGFKYQAQEDAPAPTQGGGNTVRLPDGRTKTFPNAAAADAFKKAAGL